MNLFGIKIEWTVRKVKYSYTEPVIGERATVNIPFQGYIDGNQTVAVIHTHGPYSEDLDGESFSGADCYYGIANKCTVFLVSPAGRLKVFDYTKMEAGAKTLSSGFAHDPRAPELTERFLFFEIEHSTCDKCVLNVSNKSIK